MLKKIIFGIVMVSLVILLSINVKAPTTLTFPQKLPEPYLTECQTLRAEAVFNKEFIGAKDYSKRDMNMVYLFQDGLYKYYDSLDGGSLATTKEDYVLDLWTCVIFTKEQQRTGEILNYRKENGYK